MWRQGVATDLDAPWTHSYQISAYGINNAGLVVGSTKVPNDVDYYRAVEWNDGVATFLEMPSGFDASEAKGINDAGQVVGFMSSEDFSIGFRAATWINGQVVDLNSLLPASVVAEGWVLQGANAINDMGQIVGQAYNTKTGVTDAFVLTPVPEAGTFAMMLLGLGAVVAMGARRRA
ncbi:MAG: PEP-CTERM sorting domain-containing protein [Aquabacterium sp.]